MCFKMGTYTCEVSREWNHEATYPGGTAHAFLTILSDTPQKAKKRGDFRLVNCNMEGKKTDVATKVADAALRTTTDRAPVTLQRPIDPNSLDKIYKPHVPRAVVAVDRDHPNGSPGHRHKDFTVLQQHVAFFDRNGDGIVYPWETYAGFRAVGFNVLVSFIFMFVINVGLSYRTLDGWIPSPLFPVVIRNIHQAKHGSDSEVYDTEGRFIPEKFEEIFSKYAHTKPDHLTFAELLAMTEALRNAYDPFGWIASKLEWGLAYWLARDGHGFVSRDAVRGILDGSYFEFLEKFNNQFQHVTEKRL